MRTCLSFAQISICHAARAIPGDCHASPGIRLPVLRRSASVVGRYARLYPRLQDQPRQRPAAMEASPKKPMTMRDTVLGLRDGSLAVVLHRTGRAAMFEAETLRIHAAVSDHHPHRTRSFCHLRRLRTTSTRQLRHRARPSRFRRCCPSRMAGILRSERERLNCPSSICMR